MSETNDIIIEEEKISNISIFESKIRPIVAEFLGSIILVSAVSANAVNTESTLTIFGVIYGLTMMFLIITFGEISGGYFNPVITLGYTLAGSLSIPQAVCYFFAQIIGGIVGAAFLRAGHPDVKFSFYKDFSGRQWLYASPDKDILLEAMLSEAIPTFILILTVLITTLDRKKRLLSPLAIGFSTIVCSITSYSKGRGSTSMNPVLRFGPAVAYSGRYDVDELWRYHYVYWVGPIVGTLVASLLYRFVFALGIRRIRIHRTCCKQQPCNSDGEWTKTNISSIEFGNVDKNLP